MQKLLVSIFLLLSGFFLAEHGFYSAAGVFGWAGFISGMVIILIPMFKAMYSASKNPGSEAMDYSPEKSDTDSQK